MKRALFLLALLAGFARAEIPYKVMPVGEFGGLNTDDSELTLGGGGQGRDQSPDSMNVLTDEGPGLRPRLGFVDVSTEAATDFWVLPHSNGTRFSIIIGSDGLLKADTGDGLYDIYLSTVPTGQRVAGAALGDVFYFSDATNGIKQVTFSGLTPTVTEANTAIKATILAAFKGRLWAAGIPGEERGIRGSEYLVGSNFTLPVISNPPDTDPVALTATGALDEPVRVLFPFQDKLMFMKEHSFGGIYGSRRSNFQVRIFSETSGSAYPDSVQDCDGELRWLGPSRTIWGWAGGVFSPQNLLSKDIDAILAGTAQGDANARSFTWTTQADFDRGTNNWTSNVATVNSVVLSTFGRVDTTDADFAAGTLTDVTTATVSGSLYINPTSTLFDDFSDGDFSANPVWTRWGQTTLDSMWSVSSNRLRQAYSGSNNASVLATTTTAAIGEWSVFVDRGSVSSFSRQEFGVLIGGFQASNGSSGANRPCSGYMVGASQSAAGIRRLGTCPANTSTFISLVSGSFDVDDSTFTIRRNSLGMISLWLDGVMVASATDTTYTSASYFVIDPLVASGEQSFFDNIYFPAPVQSGTFISLTGTTTLSTPLWIPTSYTGSANDGTLSVGTQVSDDGAVWDSSVAWTSGSAPASASKPYIRYTVDMVVSSTATSEPVFQDAELAARNSTGTWVSDSIPTDGMSAQGVFDADQVLNDGVIGYSVYSDSDSAKTVTNGIPVVGTFLSSQTVVSGDPVTLSTSAYMFVGSTFTISVGTQNPTLAAATLNWQTGNTLRVASAYVNQRYWLGVSISSTSNNRVLVYDRNREWQLYTGINAVAMGIYGSRLYFSNPLGIFQAETGTDDDGAAISAYYRTPTYIPSESPDVGGSFSLMRLTTEESAATLATTFRVNGGATEYSLGSMAMNATDGFQNFKLPFPTAEVKLGKYISFRFAVSATTDWRILSANLYGVPDIEPR